MDLQIQNELKQYYNNLENKRKLILKLSVILIIVISIVSCILYVNYKKYQTDKKDTIFERFTKITYVYPTNDITLNIKNNFFNYLIGYQNVIIKL